MSRKSSLNARISGLGEQSRSDLADRWERIYKCPPPKGIRRGLIERAIAWHLQAKYYGGLSPQIRRELKARAVDCFDHNRAYRYGDDEPAETAPSPTSDRSSSVPTSPASDTISSPSHLPRPGSRLVREWHGRTYHVDVIEEGYVFEGKTYQSLSVIARMITGAHWSGPRFFGLMRKR